MRDLYVKALNLSLLSCQIGKGSNAYCRSGRVVVFLNSVSFHVKTLVGRWVGV